MRNGYLNGKALAEANLTDWAAAVEEARKQHIAEKQEEVDQSQQMRAKMITVYETEDGDVRTAARRTLEALQRELPEQILKTVYEMMSEVYS